jgi:hypothetical protein
MSKAPRLNVLVALHKEAAPIIREYRLKKSQHHPTLFCNNDIQLMVSGVGATNAAFAAGQLSALAASSKAAWVNVGLAGHKNHAVGEAMLAHKVVCQASGNTWYPPRPLVGDFSSDSLTTVAKPVLSDYPTETLVDMEGAAFVQCATKVAPSELVQLFKVVSDNEASPIGTDFIAKAPALIEDSLPLIRACFSRLIDAADDYADRSNASPGIDRVLQVCHLTVAQQFKLRSLLRRWSALTTEDLPIHFFQDAPATGALERFEAHCNQRSMTTELLRV